jgi:hypothetical protein
VMPGGCHSSGGKAVRRVDIWRKHSNMIGRR